MSWLCDPRLDHEAAAGRHQLHQRLVGADRLAGRGHGELLHDAVDRRAHHQIAQRSPPGACAPRPAGRARPWPRRARRAALERHSRSSALAPALGLGERRLGGLAPRPRLVAVAGRGRSAGARARPGAAAGRGPSRPGCAPRRAARRAARGRCAGASSSAAIEASSLSRRCDGLWAQRLGAAGIGLAPASRAAARCSLDQGRAGRGELGLDQPARRPRPRPRAAPPRRS